MNRKREIFSRGRGLLALSQAKIDQLIELEEAIKSQQKSRGVTDRRKIGEYYRGKEKQKTCDDACDFPHR